MKIHWQLLLLILLCGLTFFAHLEQFSPDLMEARNFITAREMIQEGNWWSPTMNLEPRLEKPPLPTWLTAISAKWGGGLDDPFSMRFPAALIAALMVLFFYGFCKEISKERYFPLLGAMVLATSMLVIQQARTNSWDIYAHAFMMGGIWLLLRAWRKGTWLSFIGAGILMGASILSKGPVAPYALWLPFLLAYGIAYGIVEWKKYWLQALVTLILALIIGFGWNLYIYLELPEVMEYVVNKETTSWGSRHVKPFYFYLHFPLYIGIWVIFMIAAFVYPYAAPRINRWGNYRFTILWVLLSVLFLSVVPTKKERYLLPVIIPMALTVSYLVYDLIKRSRMGESTLWDRRLLRIFGIIVGLAAASAPILIWFKIAAHERSTALMLAGVLIALNGLAILWAVSRNEARTLVLFTITLVALICSGITPHLPPLYYQNPDYRGLETIRQIDDLKDLPCITDIEGINMKVVWAAGKPIVKVDFEEDDLSQYLPAAVVSIDHPRYWFPKEKMQSVEIIDYGEYDYFRKESDTKAVVTLMRMRDANQ